ncbi:hypothetical protein HHI36_021481 [Cryptolaemus montrouzieri]|uniref:Mevalonate kinase n=1 Tax=Cryptolaemus montrouzieri TaxID=559131 RepID=A0ABD2MWY3_9CUCU
MSSEIDSQFLDVSPSGDYLNKSNGIVFTVSAPGKVIIHGEHSVVYGKLALAASLGLRTSVTLRESLNLDTSAVELHFPDINLHYSFICKEIQNLLDKPLPTTMGTTSFNLEFPQRIDHDLHLKNIEGFLSETGSYQNLNKVQKNALASFLYLLIGMYSSVNVKLRPFHLSVSSQLTLGAGTGSSASFTVGLVASLLHFLKLMVKENDVADNLSKAAYLPTKLTIGSSSGVFSPEELQIISDWGFCGEKIHHGNPSGIDNAICTYGSFVVFRKGTDLEKKRITYPLRLLLINTKVSRDTKSFVMKAADFIKKYPAIGNHILEAMEEISKTALECLQNISELVDDRTKETFEKLGELSEINHGLLSILGVSHVTLEDIIRILKDYGLKGKLTGAGGGGYAICLLPPQLRDSDLDDAIANLENCGYDAKVTVLGDSGVRVDS